MSERFTTRGIDDLLVVGSYKQYNLGDGFTERSEQPQHLGYFLSRRTESITNTTITDHFPVLREDGLDLSEDHPLPEKFLQALDTYGDGAFANYQGEREVIVPGQNIVRFYQGLNQSEIERIVGGN